MSRSYHHPRHPCAGHDNVLAERARTRLQPRTPPQAPGLAPLVRALAAMRPLFSIAPRTAEDMYTRLLHYTDARTGQPAAVVDVATLTAALNLMPAAVPVLRTALERAVVERTVERAGRSPHGEMLFRLAAPANAGSVSAHGQGHSAPADGHRGDLARLP